MDKVRAPEESSVQDNTWCRVYIGLGSNLGERQKNIEAALNCLKEEPAVDVLKISSVIETEPEENTEQPKFLNAVCLVETSLSPLDLLDKLKKIERKLGRPKEYEKNSPRVIDLDILIFDDIVLKGRSLIIPHPKLSARFFVLHGLNEIAPDLFIPRYEKTAAQLLSQISDSEKNYADNQ